MSHHSSKLAPINAGIRIVSLAVACGLPILAAADVSIVVNTGPYPTVDEAARGEATVVWGDPDSGDETACTQAFAATELQHYLRRMTKRSDDFALVKDDADPGGALILIGGPGTNALTNAMAGALDVSQSDLDELGPEGYRIKTAEVDGRSVLLIAGGGRVGTLYGVYDYLHRQGCRWYAPGEVNEEVPDLDYSPSAAMDVSERPMMAMRGFHAWEKRGNPDFLLWMGRNRLNYWCVEEDNRPFLRKLGIKLVWGGHILGTDFLKPDDPYPYTYAKSPSGDSLPDDPYPKSEDSPGDENGDGVLSYREAHPEWYGLVNGERSKVLRDADVNYCTSNPHATAELMKNAVRELVDGAGADAEIVNCWTVDAGKWCECEACRGLGSPTDRNLLFVHAFDGEVKRAQAAGLINRPITVLFLAYADVLEPPTRPLPEKFDYGTCIATYFPIVRCYVHNIDDSGCPKNADYAKHLHGWAIDPDRHYEGQVCIGEYYNVSGYKCLPVCYMHTMKNDIPYYHDKMNARHFHYMHVTTGNWGNKALTNYQMARQLWDCKTDCDALWTDYFAGRYGPAAGDMREFYTSLEVMLSNVSELKYDLAGRLSSGADDLFPNPHLRYSPSADGSDLGPSMTEILAAAGECREILGRVQARSDIPHRVAMRVAEDERMFTYGERTIRFYDALARAYEHAREGQIDEAESAFTQASTLADELRSDTVSATLSSSHANAPDALSASRAGGAIERLKELIDAQTQAAGPR